MAASAPNTTHRCHPPGPSRAAHTVYSPICQQMRVLIRQRDAPRGDQHRQSRRRGSRPSLSSSTVVTGAALRWGRSNANDCGTAQRIGLPTIPGLDFTGRPEPTAAERAPTAQQSDVGGSGKSWGSWSPVERAHDGMNCADDTAAAKVLAARGRSLVSEHRELIETERGSVQTAF